MRRDPREGEADGGVAYRTRRADEAVEADEQDLPLTARLVRLVLDDPRTDPVLLGVRIVLLLMLIVWTWQFARARVIDNAAGMSFLHLINLPFHEAGHILFLPLGEFMTVLGGSLFQVIVPASLTVIFLTKHRDVFGAAVTLVVDGREPRRSRAVYRRCPDAAAGADRRQDRRGSRRPRRDFFSVAMDRNDHDGTAVTTARGLIPRASDNNGYRTQNVRTTRF